jgi:hypothetical protein
MRIDGRIGHQGERDLIRRQIDEIHRIIETGDQRGKPVRRDRDLQRPGDDRNGCLYLKRAGGYASPAPACEPFGSHPEMTNRTREDSRMPVPAARKASRATAAERPCPNPPRAPVVRTGCCEERQLDTVSPRNSGTAERLNACNRIYSGRPFQPPPGFCARTGAWHRNQIPAGNQHSSDF